MLQTSNKHTDSSSSRPRGSFEFDMNQDKTKRCSPLLCENLFGKSYQMSHYHLNHKSSLYETVDKKVSLILSNKLGVRRILKTEPTLTSVMLRNQQFLTLSKSKAIPNSNFYSAFRFTLNPLHCYVLPTAKCSSEGRDGPQTKSSYDDNDDYDNEKANKENAEEGSLPGFQRKPKISSSTQVTGEFEINQLMDSDTGWERIKYLFRMTESGQFEDVYTRRMNALLYRTVVIGFFMNTFVASVKHENEKVGKNWSRTEGIKTGMLSQAMIPKQVLKSALKDTLKLALVSASLIHGANTVSAYRNKSSIWEYTLFSGVAFGLVAMPLGMHKVGSYTLTGTAFGLATGLIVCHVLEELGQTQEQRNIIRMKKILLEQKRQTMKGNEAEEQEFLNDR